MSDDTIDANLDLVARGVKNCLTPFAFLRQFLAATLPKHLPREQAYYCLRFSLYPND